MPNEIVIAAGHVNPDDVFWHKNCRFHCRVYICRRKKVWSKNDFGGIWTFLIFGKLICFRHEWFFKVTNISSIHFLSRNSHNFSTHNLTVPSDCYGAGFYF